MLTRRGGERLAAATGTKKSVREAMPVTCHVQIVDERALSGGRPARELTFQEVPRVGEFVAFSRDGKRDEHGVLHGDLFRVKYVIHVAANDLSAATVAIDVERHVPGQNSY